MSNMLNAVHKRIFGTSVMLFCMGLLGACSGVDITPAATETFAATNYTRYAWRSEPLSQTGYSKDMLAIKSPSIRAGVEEKMAQLGYRRVDRAEAEFLVEYFATPGYNDGQLSHGGSNDMLYGSSVNRQIDGASANNALALSRPVETGDMQLVFFDAATNDVLWRVQISIVVEDANRIDHDEVRNAVGKGVSALPPVRDL
ncbi:DUF4136 domain-containing protein [Chromatocurvus halotolerans]|uniref:Uncharacterized protein DUF4136 n=1 Tax=Chromatocurvus halotolerans TaxID=1132028 RepID=A0A4R2L7A5_9GAMM|nr:DUF4136 domain-containing protein [Chromatocurvus halotolerans]TCO75095.1 uncharacterized protein DUF4136 [Chromatocurvus halotolerans]